MHSLHKKTLMRRLAAESSTRKLASFALRDNPFVPKSQYYTYHIHVLNWRKQAGLSWTGVGEINFSLIQTFHAR
jgi:hypothetical protein